MRIAGRHFMHPTPLENAPPAFPSITPRQSHNRRVTSLDAAPRTASIARPEAKTADEPVSLAGVAACHRATPCRHKQVQRYHGQSATRLQSQPIPKIASRHNASSLTYPRSQAEPIIRPPAHAPSAWMKKWGSGLAHSCGLILGRALDMRFVA